MIFANGGWIAAFYDRPPKSSSKSLTQSRLLAGQRKRHCFALLSQNLRRRPTYEEADAENLGLAPSFDGLVELGSDMTDTYVLSMSYEHKKLLPVQLRSGLLGLATKDEDGNWVNAVDNNFGGKKNLVIGPWNSSYELGTYGIDLNTHTAWAVINHGGDFAVAGFRHLPIFSSAGH